MGIKENLNKVKEQIDKVKEQIDNIKVKIIAVTKYATQQQISETYELGIRDFGESYVQDATNKISQNYDGESFSNLARWHFIGRLQKNKVKYIVPKVYLIHSVDSLELAEVIDRVAQKNNHIQDVLMQVNISQEESKTGFKPDELKNIFDRLSNLSNIKILGLMTMAPNTSDNAVIKNCFQELNNIRKEINKSYNATLGELSMGMSNDYKIAVECGATMIRLGRILFKENLLNMEDK